jgi:hypothetical protein
MRVCGECTACCEGWVTSRHLAMRPGVPCEHRTDVGCAIYERRPDDPCKQFKCAWLQSTPESLPDEMRPDRSGAILYFRAWKQWSRVLNVMPAGREVPDATLRIAQEWAAENHMPIVWSERVEDFVNDDALTRKAMGPSEFMTQVKWDFMPEDIWSPDQSV